MMDIVWSVSTLERDTSTGYVRVGHWQCTGTDGDYSGRVYSTCSWPDGQPVIPYADLTQETVLGWIWESVDKDATEAAVAAQIEAQKHPVTATGVPWSQ
jgi:hypothetical protein